MNESIKEKLDSQNWKVIIVKLTAFIENRINRTSFFKGENLFGGQKSEDIALKAIELVYTGKRKWNYEKDPDLLEYLMYSVAKSLIGNLWKSPSQKLRTSFINDENYDEDLRVDPLSNFGIEDDFERELFAKELLEEIENQLIDDEDLWQIYTYRKEGYKNNEIAVELDVPIAEVEKAIKRLRTKLTTINNKFHSKS